jgi:hypothetical protein
MNSRSKGSRYERKIAKLFSEYCGTEITRTPMSGGYNKKGDLTPKDPQQVVNFLFHLELKHREGWDFNGIFKNSKHPIWEWWKQCETEARGSNKVPILIFTKNLDLNYCMTICSIFNRMRIKTDRCIFFDDFVIFQLDDLFKISYGEIGLNLRRPII